MSHQLTNDFWDSLGPQALFLQELFHKQSELVMQLQSANNALEDQVMQAQDDVTDAAVKMASAIAQAILWNTPVVSHSSQNAKAAEPESLTGAGTKWSSSSEQFTSQSQCRLTSSQMRG